MGGSEVKSFPAVQEPQEMQTRSLGRVEPLKEGMATHSSILTWRIPWTEEPGRLQSLGPHRVRQTEAIKHAYMHSNKYEWVNIFSLL